MFLVFDPFRAQFGPFPALSDRLVLVMKLLRALLALQGNDGTTGLVRHVDLEKDLHLVIVNYDLFDIGVYEIPALRNVMCPDELSGSLQEFLDLRLRYLGHLVFLGEFLKMCFKEMLVPRYSVWVKNYSVKFNCPATR